MEGSIFKHMENMILLINELRKLDNETPWVEFKHNNYDPVMIGNDMGMLLACVYHACTRGTINQ